MLNLFENTKYKIIKAIIGTKIILKLLINNSEMNLIVVSEKIIKNIPKKNVTNFNF